jgi:hypothetical protein
MILVKQNCDTCSSVDNALVVCDPTFDANSVGWLGYGLDKYGSSAYGAPTDVLPIVKRGVFGILSGYQIKHINNRQDLYPLSEKVYVFSSAENKAYKKSSCTVGYYFTIKDLSASRLTASIGLSSGINDLNATVEVNTPAFLPGKHITMVLNAKDYAGNAMDPFTISFTLEERD